MNTFYPNTILGKLEEELAFLKNQSSEKKLIAERSLGLCQLAFLELKDYTIQNGFSNLNEEINFFKVVKPKVYGQLIFYNEIFRIETFKPLIHRKLAIKMLNDELRKIHEFIKINREFYQYYTTNQTCLDETYFTRSNTSVLIGSVNLHYLTDPQFATPRDEAVSYFIAYEEFGKYLDTELNLMKHRQKFWQICQSKKLNLKMSWTASKVALIELIYALHCYNCINNGSIHINELIRFFETMFDVNLNEAYRAFVDIKDRKREKAKFLTELKSSLISKLDAIDELN